MEKNILLKGTDLMVSPIGLGTVNAGLAWDNTDADDIFNYYLDQGGNLIDTARIYLDFVPSEIGRSERVIGDWLRRCGRRDEVVLMTKGGHPNVNSPQMRRLNKSDMAYDITLSLKTLGVDAIDIYFYHRDDVSIPVGELIEQMESFRQAGKIRYYGCSNWSTGRMIEAQDYAKAHGLDGFIANQSLYNMGTKYMNPFGDSTMVTVDKAMLDFHQPSANTLMPYFGLCSGFFHKLETMGEEAVKTSCYFTQGNLKLAKHINTLRKKYDATISQVLLGFFLTADCPMVPLVGISNMDQLIDMMKTVDVPFTKKDYVF